MQSSYSSSAVSFSILTNYKNNLNTTVTDAFSKQDNTCISFFLTLAQIWDVNAKTSCLSIQYFYSLNHVPFLQSEISLQVTFFIWLIGFFTDNITFKSLMWLSFLFSAFCLVEFCNRNGGDVFHLQYEHYCPTHVVHGYLQKQPPATLLKKTLAGCFFLNFAKFSRAPFLHNTSGRLLLYFF